MPSVCLIPTPNQSPATDSNQISAPRSVDIQSVSRLQMLWKARFYFYHRHTGFLQDIMTIYNTDFECKSRKLYRIPFANIWYPAVYITRTSRPRSWLIFLIFSTHAGIHYFILVHVSWMVLNYYSKFITLWHRLSHSIKVVPREEKSICHIGPVGSKTGPISIHELGVQIGTPPTKWTHPRGSGHKFVVVFIYHRWL